MCEMKRISYINPSGLYHSDYEGIAMGLRKSHKETLYAQMRMEIKPSEVEKQQSVEMLALKCEYFRNPKIDNQKAMECVLDLIKCDDVQVIDACLEFIKNTIYSPISPEIISLLSYLEKVGFIETIGSLIKKVDDDGIVNCILILYHILYSLHISMQRVVDLGIHLSILTIMSTTKNKKIIEHGFNIFTNICGETKKLRDTVLNDKLVGIMMAELSESQLGINEVTDIIALCFAILHYKVTEESKLIVNVIDTTIHVFSIAKIEEDIIELALETLEVCSISNYSKIIEADMNVLNKIISLITSQNEQISFLAINIIGNICYNGVYSVFQCLQEGCLAQLIKILQSTKVERLRKSACFTLSNIVGEQEYIEFIYNEGAFTFLTHIALFGEQDTRKEALHAIANGLIQKNMEIALKICNDDTINAVLKGITENQNETQLVEHLLKSMASMTRYGNEDINKVFACNGGMELMNLMAISDKKNIAQLADEILKNMMEITIN